jgi:hypothetical protein
MIICASDGSLLSTRSIQLSPMALLTLLALLRYVDCSSYFLHDDCTHCHVTFNCCSGVFSAISKICTDDKYKQLSDNIVSGGIWSSRGWPKWWSGLGWQVGKLADLVLWSPGFFGAKPELVIKGGIIAWAQMGDANASIPTPEPVCCALLCHAYELSTNKI